MGRREGGETELVRLASTREFLAAAGAVLETKEDENNLMLGVALARLAAERGGIAQPAALLAHLGRASAPDAVLLMSPPSPLLIARIAGDPESLGQRLEVALRSLELPVHGVLSDVDTAAAFASAWSAPRKVRVTRTVRERLHRLDSVAAVESRPGRLVQAAPRHFPLLVDWIRAFHAEALPDEPPIDPAHRVGIGIEEGDYFVWEEKGDPIGLAARGRRTPRGICIDSVYTPPEHRAKGVATSGVAALSRLLLAESDFCVLYTDVANPSSSALYRRIGYRPVRDFDLHWIGPAGLADPSVGRPFGRGRQT